MTEETTGARQFRESSCRDIPASPRATIQGDEPTEIERLRAALKQALGHIDEQAATIEIYSDYIAMPAPTALYRVAERQRRQYQPHRDEADKLLK